MLPEFRSACPIASALDLLGDRWTLVILRTMFVGGRRYADFAATDERIATNILADRLEKLERHGLVEKRPYQANPPRHEYRLTARGADTLPILQALAVWGARHIPGRLVPPPWFLAARPQDVPVAGSAGPE